MLQKWQQSDGLNNPVRSGGAAVGKVSRGHSALIPNAYGLTSIATCALRLRFDSVLAWVGGLLFPLPYQGVLVVKVYTYGVRWRLGGRL